MAQTYNIYLRKRLTEFDLIIRNLPYRDGLVIYNRMYLDAMVNYLYLQKFIVGDTDTKLVSEIDNLLERVFNIFSSGMELGAELELFAAKPTGGSTELVLTTGKANIGEESFNTFQNVTQLLTNTLKYDIAKSLGSGSTEMELRTAPASTLKEALEKFKNTMLLDSDASTSAITHGEAETDMVLTTNDFDIFYMLSVEGEAMMNLLFSADFEMWYTLGTGDSSMCLTVENSGVQSKKFMTYESFLNLVLEIGNILQCFIFPDESGSLLSSELNIGMKRHRLLSEMDNLTLSEHDDITLEELDYVILAWRKKKGVFDMSKGTLGSFNGTTTANVNMLDIFKQNEMAAHENSTLAFTDHMVIKKIGIQCEAGTEVIINGCEIPIVSGVFELGFGQVDITSLVFKEEKSVNIYYMY